MVTETRQAKISISLDPEGAKRQLSELEKETGKAGKAAKDRKKVEKDETTKKQQTNQGVQRFGLASLRPLDLTRAFMRGLPGGSVAFKVAEVTSEFGQAAGGLVKDFVAQANLGVVGSVEGGINGVIDALNSYSKILAAAIPGLSPLNIPRVDVKKVLLDGIDEAIEKGQIIGEIKAAQAGLDAGFRQVGAILKVVAATGADVNIDLLREMGVAAAKIAQGEESLRLQADRNYIERQVKLAPGLFKEGFIKILETAVGIK